MGTIAGPRPVVPATGRPNTPPLRQRKLRPVPGRDGAWCKSNAEETEPPEAHFFNELQGFSIPTRSRTLDHARCVGHSRCVTGIQPIVQEGTPMGRARDPFGWIPPCGRHFLAPLTGCSRPRGVTRLTFRAPGPGLRVCPSNLSTTALAGGIRYRRHVADLPRLLRVLDEREGRQPQRPGALALAPQNPRAHVSEGLAQLCLGDRAGARRSFEQALALDPAQPKVREYLKSL
jgi:hypothetical protein